MKCVRYLSGADTFLNDNNRMSMKYSTTSYQHDSFFLCIYWFSNRFNVNLVIIILVFVLCGCVTIIKQREIAARVDGLEDGPHNIKKFHFSEPRIQDEPDI